MAEKSTAKKPQSLNNSHYQFLQDLSSHPNPKPKPQCSDEIDEDSENLRIGGRSGLFSEDDNVPSFSVITDFDTPAEEKSMKMKIKGRRRLCKLVKKVEGAIDEPDFSEITDFESPPAQTKDMKRSGKNRGDNEIMDILGELSSKLELLSIEKRKANPEMPYLIERSLPILKLEAINEEERVEPPEYASAGSSFSQKSASSDSSLDANGDRTGRVDGNCTKESELDVLVRNGQTERSFVSEVKEEKDHNQTKHECYMKNEVSRPYANRVIESEENHEGFKNKLVSLGKPSVNRVVEEDEDDCVVLSGTKFSKDFKKPERKFKKYDISDDDDILEDEGSITLRGARYTYKLSSGIATMLFPHQCEGLKWLWSLHCQGKGGILGDDMGLGKTMQICGFLAGLFSSCLIKRVMIVAPKTLLAHWIKELSAVGLSDKIKEYYGNCLKARQYELQYVLQDKGILLTTYDIVRLNSKALRGGNYFYDDESEDSITWDYMILDEGHLIKNPSTQRAKSLLEIPSAHRIIISGTPIQNNLKELWALFNFCCPELLGDKQSFKDRYENPILSGNDKMASERQKRRGTEVAKELRECIKPYFLRRLKSEVFNKDSNQGKQKLSKKNEIIVWLRLTACQRQIYEAYLKSELVLSAFDGSPLAALTILKKICDHPLLLTKRAAEDVLEEMDSMLKPEELNVANKLAMYIADAAGTDEFEENHVTLSCKIAFISTLVDDLIPKGHNVLIFSQTRKMLNLIQDSLASNGYEYLRIDGTTKVTDRMKIVNDYQNGEGPPIFLLTSQVGGLGLTLTRADRVIVVDPAWNPSTDNQSVDRAYRIGQTKDVIVYRLMTCGTVEEKIYRKQIFKGGLFRTATEQKEQTRYFSQADLCELFSLPAQGFDVSPTQLQLHEEHDSLHVMDEQLKAHIKFLESQGIAGVSHHSLLFSNSAPVQNSEPEEEVIIKTGSTFVGPSVLSNAVERSFDGSEYAFKPKDVRLMKKSPSPDGGGKLSKSDIKERMDRLSKTLANKAMMSRLPDKGNKIELQLLKLNDELQRLKKEKQNGKQVIDVDSFSGDFQRVLNV